MQRKTGVIAVVELQLLKRGRKYWECRLDERYAAKLVIDEATRDLPLGTHHLRCKDVSKRSRYGTDLRYVVITDDSQED